MLAIACLVAALSTPEARASPGARFERDMMVRYHMHANLDVSRALERMLLHGRLDEARTLARAIAEAPVEPGLGAWTQAATLVRTRAAELAASPSLDEGCRRAAAMAAACAGCHVEARVQPEFREPPPLPPDADSVPARMARHRWAADRMWEGLVGGDDETWAAGLAVIAAAPLAWPKGDERAQLARRLQELGSQKRTDRTQLYGELLVTCAACHAIR